MTGMACPRHDDVRKAVDAYNRENGCGDADAKVWHKTAHARALVLGSDDAGVTPMEIVRFVESVRLWGEIQGVSKDEYPRAARALWSSPVRTRIRALNGRSILAASLTEVVELEEAFVQEMLRAGIAKRHYSWTSKMLHLLLPATMPVYDSVVRDCLGTTDGINGYEAIAARVQACAKELALNEAEIVGSLEPKTLVRALDKYYWWRGTHPGSG